MVEPKLPKLLTWVRFPSPAPTQRLAGPRAPLQRKSKSAKAAPARAPLKGRVLRREVEGRAATPRIMAVAARLPVIRRFAPTPPPPPPKKTSRVRKVLGVPGRLLGRLRPKAEPPPPPARSIPFVSPVMRRVRQPLASTARMVQVAREARKPKSVFARMRETAQLLIEGDGASSRIERVAGLAIAASAPRSQGLRMRLFGPLNENAGAGKPRTGANNRKSRRDQS
jgi:hypothetical protein